LVIQKRISCKNPQNIYCQCIRGNPEYYLGLYQDMRMVCISSAQVPSETANSIQVMKVCQAFTQLGNEVILLVPGTQLEGLKPADLQTHYGLQTTFGIEWMPVRNRRLFPWAAVQHARTLNADLLYVWPVQSAALGLLAGMPSMLELHDFPSGCFGPLWLSLFLAFPGRKRVLPITEALQRALDLPAKQTVSAPDGVDLERYASLPSPELARCELGLPAAPTVLCTGHLYEGRGADVFLGLAGKFPKASFIWVGGRTADVESWNASANEQSLTNVIFTGFVPNERIPLYQAAADVLLMPYQQTVATSSGGNTAAICSPMKMFEYMAAGRAILSSNLPVLREVLDETSAVFCPSDSVEAWESALGGLLKDKEKRQALGQHARRAVEQYSWIERSRRALENFM
jgi:glycosyltransferase involved in cell wall biosynthesis